MTNRIRRTLLALAVVAFALIASTMEASAGGGECGFCTENSEFCDTQENRFRCDDICEMPQVTECVEHHIDCNLEMWVTCGFET